MVGAGFRVEGHVRSFASGCCGHFCLNNSVTRRYRVIDREYNQYRWGDWVLPKPRREMELVDPKSKNYTESLRNYRRDCLLDMDHPDSNHKFLSYEVAGCGTGIALSSGSWYGMREVGLNKVEEETPFSALNITHLDAVITKHNAKWGKIKTIDRNGLDLEYIFPGQTG